METGLELVDTGGATGFDRLTLAAVADRAGVAVPSLYKHIGGLDDLRLGVATAAVGKLGEVVATAAIGRSGADALRAVARGIRSFGLEHPGWYAAAQFAPASGDDPALAEASDAVVRSIVAVLRAFDVPDDRTVDAVRVVRSGIHGFVSLELGGGFGLPDDLDRSFDLVVEAVIAGVDGIGQR